MGVDFFFLLSGYLMLKSAAKIRGGDKSVVWGEVAFILHKVGAFFPELLVSVLMSAILFFIENTGHPGLLMQTLGHSLFADVLLLKSTGLVSCWGDLNPMVWYLSTMLLGIAVLLPMFRRLGCRLEMFVLVVAGMGMLIMATEDMTWPLGKCLGTYHGNIRGLLELALGAFCYYVVQAVRRYDYTALFRTILTFGKYASVAYMFYAVFKGDSALYGKYILMSSFAIMTMMSGLTYSPRVLSCPLTFFLGKMGLALFLGHFCVHGKPAYFCSWHLGVTSLPGRLCVYYALAFVSGLIVYQGGQLLRRWWASIPPGTFVKGLRQE